ncbi:MAG: hypothetical protein KatS3mg123_1270 [Burkholderiales bacterium]|nr:MAG: hypothetical protein KatS3mg123_1270 [Burkholderiales bacterium]
MKFIGMNKKRRAGSSLWRGLGYRLALVFLAMEWAGGRALAMPPLSLGLDHPLTGRIWSPGAQRFLSSGGAPGPAQGKPTSCSSARSTTTATTTGSRPGSWSASGRAGHTPLSRGAVAFEMITADEAAALEVHARDDPVDAARLGAALRWEERGWPAWSLYQPIAEAAIKARMALIAAGAPRALEREVRSRGLAALDDERLRRLALEALPEAERSRLEEELYESHCRQLPREALPGMVAVQQLRDAWMADRLLEGWTRTGGPVVAIAGRGHTRPDWGIPRYLAIRAPGARIASVAMVEVDPRKRAPSDYGDARQGDYLVFTGAAPRADPCEALRRPRASG